MDGILGRNATANLNNGVKYKTVTVAGGAASGTSSADAELAGGAIVGFYPSAGTSANAVLQSIAMNASTGVITVTLGANTTNAHTYTVIVAVPSGDIA